MRRLIIVLLVLLGAFQIATASEKREHVAAFFQGQTFKSSGGGACASGPLDTFAASPGAWTVAYSLRVLKATFASGGGNAVQLQRSSDSATLNIGFNGCNPDTTSSAAFCNTASLSAGTTTSARAAFPTGSVIHIFNTGPNDVFYAAGNGSVTATTNSTTLPLNQGANITVGANTNLAAIIGNGFGLNGTAGSATILMTNCGASIAYEQSGSGAPNGVQGTLANQMGYYPSCSASGYSCLVGCLVGCNLHAADSATYKTSTVETFTVMTFGEDTTSANFNYAGVVYPTTSSSNASDTRWGFVNTGDPDIVANNINGNNGGNAEGFGGLWRKQFLTQFDYSTGGVTRWNGSTQFLSTGSGTPTYPNAVGLYVMGSTAGDSTPGMFVETMIASGTQTSRNSISANQVSYWGITSGAASQIALTNPLSDGWNFNAQQIGGFAPNPPGPGSLTINGNSYASESSWNPYSNWQATNGTTASGQKGDMYRFQVTGLFDQWQGTFRSEVDGAPSQISVGVDFWLAYAVLIEPGTAYNSAWNITGQMHDVAGPVCCIFNIESNTNSGVTDTFFIQTFNATSGAQTSNSTGMPFTRNRYYNFVFHVFPSTAGTTDTFDAWVDAVTPGTMVHEVSLTGSLFGGNSVSNANYWKYGIYRETGASLPTFADRFGNVQLCTTGAGCTAKYGTSDLSAQTTTPLANPAHL